MSCWAKPGCPAILPGWTTVPEAALWNHQPTKEVFAELRRNSLSIQSRESQLLAKAASDHEVVLVIGVNERVDEGPGNGTLYNSLLTFGSDGALLKPQTRSHLHRTSDLGGKVMETVSKQLIQPWVELAD